MISERRKLFADFLKIQVMVFWSPLGSMAFQWFFGKDIVLDNKFFAAFCCGTIGLVFLVSIYFMLDPELEEEKR